MMDAQELEQKYGQWGSDPEFPARDWRMAVANDETRLGYWEWVVVQREAERP